jgi:hypothetical protein
MAWLFVPGSADSSSQREPSGPISESSATSSLTHTPLRYSATDSPLEISTPRQSGTTCEPSTVHPGVDAWISSLRGIRARARVTRGNVSGQPTSGGCGPIFGGSFARRMPDGWHSKTSQRISIDRGQLSPLIWPRAGGVSSGIAYQRRPLARRTSAIEYSLSRHRQWLRALFPSLRGLLPTPTAADSSLSGAANYSTASGRHSGTTLTDVIVRSRPGGTRIWHLDPRFVEWMMAFPLDWTAGVAQRHRLRLLGNAVVWPAAAEAYRVLLERIIQSLF